MKTFSTRRKAKMELRSRRRIQSAGSDQDGNAAITAANAGTPFLGLPQEIKNGIYQLVLGGSLLHIKRDLLTFKRNVPHSKKGAIKKRRFTNHICCSQISEEQAHHAFDTEDSDSLHVKEIELRHSGCHSPTSKAPAKMNINLLHCCRQIYNEACFIPYSTNIFSFDTPRILRSFMHHRIQRGVNFNKAIRGIHLDLVDVRFKLHAWTQALNATTQHMTLLNTTYVNVDQCPNWTDSDDLEEKKKAMRPLLDCLAILGKPPVNPTTIIVSDQYVASLSDAALISNLPAIIRYRWTVKEKRLWVAEVKLAVEHMRSFCRNEWDYSGRS